MGMPMEMITGKVLKLPIGMVNPHMLTDEL